MNDELKFYQKRFSKDEYLRMDDEIWHRMTYHIPDLPGEEWRKIKGWEFYEISNMGRVKRTIQERFYGDKNSYPVLYGEKLAGITYTSSGYAQVSLSIFGRCGVFYVHRLVADAFLPPALPGQTEVHHKDGNPRNNRFDNLQRCTSKEHKYFNNWREKTGQSRKKYLASLTTEERRERTKHAVKKRMRQVICNGKIYESIKAFADTVGKKPSTVYHWLSGYTKMADKYKKQDLRYLQGSEKNAEKQAMQDL